jgi:DNA-binding response OmpR family regulator
MATKYPIRLLYVEDEIITQSTVELALREAGFEPFIASSGDEAMEVLGDKRRELRGLITDVKLGTAQDGWDVARRAREIHPDLPVVYSSVVGHDHWTVHGVPLSVMIAKPFAPPHLISAMTCLLGMPTAETAPDR